jgi:hypothetical protein
MKGFPDKVNLGQGTTHGMIVIWRGIMGKWGDISDSLVYTVPVMAEGDLVRREVKLLMGNEAIALGAIRAGVRVVSGYPGTPST